MTWQMTVAIERFRLPPAELQDLAAIGDDVPVPLQVASDLPELAGQWSPKRLRKAIADGLLSAEQHGRTLYVTRADIRTWREKCRVSRNPPAYGSNPSASIPTAASVRTPDGSSEMARRKLALAAALETTLGLRKR